MQIQVGKWYYFFPDGLQEKKNKKLWNKNFPVLVFCRRQASGLDYFFTLQGPAADTKIPI